MALGAPSSPLSRSTSHTTRRTPTTRLPESVRPSSAAHYRQSASALRRCSHQHASSNHCGIGTSTAASTRRSWSSSVRRELRSTPDTRPVWAWPARCWRQAPPKAKVLALCRWRSASSLRVYAHISFKDYTSWLRRAEAEDARAIQGPNLPALPAQAWPGTADAVPGARKNFSSAHSETWATAIQTSCASSPPAPLRRTPTTSWPTSNASAS